MGRDCGNSECLLHDNPCAAHTKASLWLSFLDQTRSRSKLCPSDFGNGILGQGRGHSVVQDPLDRGWDHTVSVPAATGC